MSTSVNDPGAGATGEGRGLGLASAGLAVVIVVGIAAALVPGTAENAPAPGQISDSRQVVSQLSSEGRSPGGNVEHHKVAAGIIHAPVVEVFNIEEYRISQQLDQQAREASAARQQAYADLHEEAQKTGLVRTDADWSRYQTYVESLMERAQKTGTGQAGSG